MQQCCCVADFITELWAKKSKTLKVGTDNNILVVF
jgi:hypothetical protein